MSIYRTHTDDVAPYNQRRLNVFAAIVMVCGLVIFVQIFQIQFRWGNELRRIGDKQECYHQSIKQRRGNIYDVTGRPLSNLLSNYVALSIELKRLTDPQKLVHDLSSVFGKSPEFYQDIITSGGSNVEIARKVSPEQLAKIKQLGWQLNQSPDGLRVYPHGSCMSQVIGVTDIDSRGICGAEAYFDDILEGKAGERVVRAEASRKPHLKEGLLFQPSRDGGDVILTLDVSLQSMLEEELNYALDRFQPKTVSGIILNPRNGAVLSLATLPSFDPNIEYERVDSFMRNRSLTDLHEPGSTFKVIAASLLLERGLATPETRVDCAPGYVVFYGDTIRDSHLYGTLTFKEVIAYSSNVGMIHLTETLNHMDFYQHICKFGFLGRTGIELRGEVKGELLDPGNWNATTRPTVVIGQSISTNMLQMCMAYAAIANKGLAVQPTILYGIRYSDGRFEKNPVLPLRRMISEKTASTVTDFLVEAVESGTGTLAKIDGLTIAGKTGTGQKPDLEEGGYHDDKFYSSFIGYFPVENPEFLVMVALDEPDGLHAGGSTAAPVFRRIAERITSMKPHIRICTADDPLDENMVVVPDLTFLSIAEAERRLKAIDLVPRFYGEGAIVHDQLPYPEVVIDKAGVVDLTLGPLDRPSDDKVIVPVLIHLSMREAVRKATEAGLVPRISGHGLVVRQSLAYGSRVSFGETCELTTSGY